MTMRISSSLGPALFAFTLMALVLHRPDATAAGDSAYQVQLVWGTNGEKPKDKPLKDVDPKLQDKLKGLFKWGKYYEVSSQALPVPKEAASQKLKLSEKCEVQVQDLGGSRIEIRLFGEGKPVVKRTQAVVPGELIILGGDSENNTAWFVVLLPPK
jgi:hypothetical protein